MEHPCCLHSYMNKPPGKPIRVVTVHPGTYILHFEGEETHSGLECGVVDNRDRAKLHYGKHEFLLDLLFSNGPPSIELKFKLALQNAIGERVFCVHVSYEISLHTHLINKRDQIWRRFNGYVELGLDTLIMLRNLIRGLIYLLKRGCDISTLSSDMIVFCKDDTRRIKPQIIPCMLGTNKRKGSQCAQSSWSSSKGAQSSWSSSKGAQSSSFWSSSEGAQSSSFWSSSKGDQSSSSWSSSKGAQSSWSSSKGVSPLSRLADIIEEEIISLLDGSGERIHPMVTSFLNCLRGGIRGRGAAPMYGISPTRNGYRMEEEITYHPMFLNSEERATYVETSYRIIKLRPPFRPHWLDIREICDMQSVDNCALESHYRPPHDWSVVLTSSSTSTVLSNRFDDCIENGSYYDTTSVAECVRFNRNSINHVNDDYVRRQPGQQGPTNLSPIGRRELGQDVMRCWPNLLPYLFEIYGTGVEEASLRDSN